MVDHVALAWVSSSPTAENARVATSSRLDAPRRNEWTTALLSTHRSTCESSAGGQRVTVTAAAIASSWLMCSPRARSSGVNA